MLLAEKSVDIAEDDWVALLESSGEDGATVAAGDTSEVVTSGSGVDLKSSADNNSVEADEEDLFRYSTLNLDEDVRDGLFGAAPIEESESSKMTASPSRPTSSVIKSSSASNSSSGAKAEEAFFV